MLVQLLAWLGHKRSIRLDLARRVVAAFDDVDWRTQSFSIGNGPQLAATGGETCFYRAGEIDAAIKRLNKVLTDLTGPRPPVEARLVSCAEDGATCTLNIGGVEYYYDRVARSDEAQSAPDANPPAKLTQEEKGSP